MNGGVFVSIYMSVCSYMYMTSSLISENESVLSLEAAIGFRQRLGLLSQFEFRLAIPTSIRGGLCCGHQLILAAKRQKGQHYSIFFFLD